MSNFQTDLKAEQILSKFLDKFLYKKLDIQEFFRNSHGDNQYKGIDNTFKFKGIDYIVDEKATLNYPNGLSTFAFELAYKKNNVWKKGWFYDDTKYTEYFLLAWPKRKDVKLNQFKEDDIKTVEVMLIPRNKLQTYLYENYKINEEYIINAVKKIIEDDRYGRLKHIINSENLYFYYTQNLAETPINLIIPKKTLKKLALFHFIIYRNKPYAKKEKYINWLKTEYRY